VGGEKRSMSNAENRLCTAVNGKMLTLEMLTNNKSGIDIGRGREMYNILVL